MFLLCSTINGINEPIISVIIIISNNNDVIEEKRLLNFSLDLRNDENGLNINVKTIDIRIYIITALTFISNTIKPKTPDNISIDFRID